ncbi:serine protease [Mesorhizobium sp. M1060]|uniref:trypsin-like serine peptidase n=1 Tax=unclassified Mesorhizobium TaxID=325217 RepID=UPI0003D05221|nr:MULTISPECIES: serine protease [unclassified Mesorhizobium]ESZ04412.1 hypothetical protein X736_22070 [Mesorhizobium sp. L2C089B000]WJI52355.1 serine protease [Mesorhizobium sp. C089B]
MALEEKYGILLARAGRALGKNKVSQAVAKVKAIIGPQNIPDSEAKAQSALNKLHKGTIPSASELAALEIVIRLLRPVVYSRHGGVLDDLPEKEGHNLHSLELKDMWSEFRKKVAKVVNSIGRIELEGTHVGTGFVVGEGGLLATNRHVLAALTYGSEVLAAGRARVVFKQEYDETNADADFVAIKSVASIHPKLDMVLLNLAKHRRPPVEVELEPIVETARVVAIGYPAKDEINNPLFLSGVFGDGFGVRRAALGEVLDGSGTPTLFHDCSTTQGNSGSPIFSLKTARVAGIHRAGFFMYRNEAVDALELNAFINTPTV